MATLGGNLNQQARCLYYNQGHQFQFVEPCFKRGGDLCHFIPKGRRCWAVYMADMAPPLVALGAEVTLTGPDGERRIPLEDLYTGEAVEPLSLGSAEILSQVAVPSGPLGRSASYGKFTLRGGLEFGALGVAAAVGGVLWPSSVVRATGERLRLDDFLPEYQFVEYHEGYVRTTEERLVEAVRKVSLADMPVAVFLMCLRGLADGNVDSQPPDPRPILDTMVRPGSDTAVSSASSEGSPRSCSESGGARRRDRVTISTAWAVTWPMT